eukprot:TRINITY_DN19702_c0_g1_i1.p1 TRINITY_DN19702_c0_g1~~TRINITY_DN19702_c0_g1_i1.p1  ORF type:complete len:254 (-),score=115.49 TRINITY_DN19702_c0_g1_i1:274-1035(-)
MAELAPSDLYPVLRRFLVETGLQRTLKAFDKETAPEDEEAAPTKAKKKLAKKLANCELLGAVQAWLEGGVVDTPAAVAAPAAAEVTAPPTPRKRKGSDASEIGKKRKKSEVAEEQVAAPPTPKKKKRKSSADLTAEATKPAKAAEAPAAEAAPKNGKKKEKGPNVPFSRIDHDKWVGVATAKDKRLLDNTHEAKDKYGVKGDSWGDQASEDLLKVKGKGFRKEMAKKKRASWRGGGEISQVTNSIPLDDSSEE